jgi:hypothetical protein
VRILLSIHSFCMQHPVRVDPLREGNKHATVEAELLYAAPSHLLGSFSNYLGLAPATISSLLDGLHDWPNGIIIIIIIIIPRRYFSFQTYGISHYRSDGGLRDIDVVPENGPNAYSNLTAAARGIKQGEHTQSSHLSRRGA